MKRTESYIWKKLKAGIPEAHFTRHEDGTTFGIPDVSYGLNGRNGWIELKSYHLPLLSSIPSFSKFKRTQRRWLKKRGEAGGLCFVLVGFGDNLLLIHWKDIDHCGTATYAKLINLSIWIGPIKNIKAIQYDLETKL